MFEPLTIAFVCVHVCGCVFVNCYYCIYIFIIVFTNKCCNTIIKDKFVDLLHQQILSFRVLSFDIKRMPHIEGDKTITYRSKVRKLPMHYPGHNSRNSAFLLHQTAVTCLNEPSRSTTGSDWLASQFLHHQIRIVVLPA